MLDVCSDLIGEDKTPSFLILSQDSLFMSGEDLFVTVVTQSSEHYVSD